MSEKIWKYCYEDDIVKRIVKHPITGEDTPSLTCKNRHLFSHAHMVINTETWKFHIYSDKPISGLTLVRENITEVKAIFNTDKVNMMEIN